VVTNDDYCGWLLVVAVVSFWQTTKLCTELLQKWQTAKMAHDLLCTFIAEEQLQQTVAVAVYVACPLLPLGQLSAVSTLICFAIGKGRAGKGRMG